MKKIIASVLATLSIFVMLPFAISCGRPALSSELEVTETHFEERNIGILVLSKKNITDLVVTVSILAKDRFGYNLHKFVEFDYEIGDTYAGEEYTIVYEIPEDKYNGEIIHSYEIKIKDGEVPLF